MSILVYAENHKGSFKKTAYEAVFYGKQIAQQQGTECIALVIGDASQAGVLGKYGADRVVHISDAKAAQFDSQVYAAAISEAAQSLGAHTVVMTNSADGKALLGRVGVRLEAGTVSGVTALPDLSNGFKVAKSVFSGKAIAHYEITTDKKAVSVSGNSLQISEIGSDVSPEPISVNLPEPKVKVTEVKIAEGTVPLPEAELVVSAGRGMKGPENWGIIEELAQTLGATTACSRPVADSDWRPHHEHVGQTGVAIKPNLYIAAGISGAIQHLAGVNNSKVIVVINKDPEAPFFKAADYGVQGDLFEVVPRLTEALKKYKG